MRAACAQRAHSVRTHVLFWAYSGLFVAYSVRARKKPCELRTAYLVQRTILLMRAKWFPQLNENSIN